MKRRVNAARGCHKMNKRIGFFAGAFDPIHDGHLEVARSAVEFLELEALNFMVDQKPWSAKKPVLLKHRVKMVELAIKEDRKINQILLSDSRFDIKNTLLEIENKYIEDELYFIFGADVFLNMNSINWPNLEKLLKHYIVVFERGEVTENQITKHAKSLGIVTAIIPSKHMNHKSSDVRLQPNNSNIWVPKLVAEYITEQRLY